MSAETPEQPTEERERNDRQALYQKLLKAQEEAGEIEKTGDGDGFKFAKAADVVKEAKRILHGHNLVVLPSQPETQTNFRENGGLKENGALTKVNMVFEITDADTGYSITIEWVGHGFDDPGDKAGFKGTTGTTKYFYAGVLQILFVDQDPEYQGDPDGLTEELEATVNEAEDRINGEREVERQDAIAEQVGR